MIIPTDCNVLLRDLGAYAYGAAPAELADKLQALQGSAVDRIFTGIELLYAFREQADLTLLGQLSGFVVTNQWQHPGEPDRIQRIYNGVLRDVEGTVFTDLVDPDPKTIYRSDQQDWRTLVAPNLDQLKATKRAAVDNQLGIKFYMGFTPTTGPLASKNLQTRSDTDRTNWLTSSSRYLAKINEGNGALVEATFRTADNQTITCSYQEGYDTLQAMADWGTSLMQHSWNLKDQITAAADQTALDAVDITTGWPV